MEVDGGTGLDHLPISTLHALVTGFLTGKDVVMLQCASKGLRDSLEGCWGALCSRVSWACVAGALCAAMRRDAARSGLHAAPAKGSLPAGAFIPPRRL